MSWAPTAIPIHRDEIHCSEFRQQLQTTVLGFRIVEICADLLVLSLIGFRELFVCLVVEVDLRVWCGILIGIQAAGIGACGHGISITQNDEVDRAHSQRLACRKGGIQSSLHLQVSSREPSSPQWTIELVIVSRDKR